MYTRRAGSGAKNTEQFGTGVSSLRKKKNDRENQERKIDRKEERRKQGERRGREGRERGKEGGREGGEMETNCQGRTMFLFPALLSEVFPSSEADVQHHVKVYLGRKHRLNLPRSRQICCHSACGTV